jgi:hypothetical protein
VSAFPPDTDPRLRTLSALLGIAAADARLADKRKQVIAFMVMLWDSKNDVRFRCVSTWMKAWLELGNPAI